MATWSRSHYDKEPPYRQNIHPQECTMESFRKQGDGIDTRDYGHGGTGAFVRLYGREKFDEYKKYIVVRNPIDQCKSLLNQFVKHNERFGEKPNQWGSLECNEQGVRKALLWVEARLKDFFILEKQKGVMFDEVVRLGDLTKWFKNLYESNGEKIKWTLSHKGNTRVDVETPNLTDEDLDYIQNAEYMKYVRETYCG